MSYDLLFMTGEGKTVSRDDLCAWFKERAHYSVGEDSAAYSNTDTGFSFSFGLPHDVENRVVANFSLETPAPSIIGEEAEHEVRAFAEQFGLLVWDRQTADGALGPHSRERFLQAFDAYNRQMYTVYFAVLGSEKPPLLSRSAAERIWKWNYEAQALEPGDDVYVPCINLAIANERLATFVALAGAISVRLPEVDYLVTAQSGLIDFAAVRGALEGAAKEDEPIEHWVLNPPPAAFAKALDDAETSKHAFSPVPAQRVLCSDVMRDVIEAAAREKAETAQMHALASAYNQARYEEALRLSHGITGQYAGLASLIRAVTYGELARYDECHSGFASYLAGHPNDAMAWNSHGYFLSCTDQPIEAEKAYQRALSLLEAALEEDSDNADLWSRRAYALLGLTRYAEAVSAAEKGLAIKPTHSLCSQHCGRGYLLDGNLQSAKDYLEKAVGLDEHSPYAAYYLALTQAKLGDVPAAQRNLNKVSSCSPHLHRLASKEPKLAALMRSNGSN